MPMPDNISKKVDAGCIHLVPVSLITKSTALHLSTHWHACLDAQAYLLCKRPRTIRRLLVALVIKNVWRILYLRH